MPRAPNHAEASVPNNVAITFLNAEHLLPKGLGFVQHGGAKFVPLLQRACYFWRRSDSINKFSSLCSALCSSCDVFECAETITKALLERLL